MDTRHASRIPTDDHRKRMRRGMGQECQGMLGVNIG